MTRRAIPPAIVVAFVAMTACGVPGQTHPTQLGNNDVQIVTPATTVPLPLGTPTRHIELCLVSGDHLTPALTELAAPLSVVRTLQALINAQRNELPAGTRTAINDPNLLTAKPTTRGIARIDLDPAFTQIPPADQILALAQVVCTLTSLPGIGQVHFTSAGQPIDIPRADGSLTNQPVSRSDYKTLLPGS